MPQLFVPMATVVNHKSTFSFSLCNLGEWNSFNLFMASTRNCASVHMALFSAKAKPMSSTIRGDKLPVDVFMSSQCFRPLYTVRACIGTQKITGRQVTKHSLYKRFRTFVVWIRSTKPSVLETNAPHLCTGRTKKHFMAGTARPIR